MASQKERSFSEIESADYLHPESEPLSSMIDESCLVWNCEFQKKDDFESVYLSIGDTKDNAKWYFSTSSVIADQCKKMKKYLGQGPVRATLRIKESNNGNEYYCFE